MRKTLRTALFLIATPIGVPEAHAASNAVPADGVKTSSFGTMSCGSLFNPRLRFALQYFVIGYVSGVNVFPERELDILRGLDADAINLWIDSYCRGHPLERIDEAAKELIQSLETRAKD
jgi:hypothetical protein